VNDVGTSSAATGAPGSATFPKIELHVHLEGTVRAETLLRIAKRNGTGVVASLTFAAAVSSRTSRLPDSAWGELSVPL
jgi:Adenosine deaminase